METPIKIKVLDACAAPGNKLGQLVDYM